MTESELLKRLMLGLTDPDTRVFRNQVGQGWYGAHLRIGRHVNLPLCPGDVVVRNARHLQAGLCVGSSDLVGWRTVVVTPDMVGRDVALFCAIEAKAEAGRLTPEQANFLQRVRDAGGIGVEARSVEQAIEEIKQQRGRA
jgi:hypothetical protein